MKRAPVVVGTYTIAWFLLNIFRAALPILLPELRKLYEIGFSDAGLIFALLFAGLALVQFPSGLIADIAGDRLVVFTSLVASSILLSLFGFVRSIRSLLVLAFFFGVAVGGFRSVAISSVTKAVSEDRRSGALGIMAAGNPLGNLFGPVLAAFGIIALGVVGMPVALGTTGIIIAACLGVVLVHTGADELDERELSSKGREDDSGPEVRHRTRSIVDVMTSPAGILIVIASMAFSATWQGMFAFLPTYLVEVRHLALDGTGVVTGITFGVGVLANVFAGRAADRIGDAAVLLAAFLVGTISVMALRTATTLPFSIVALVGLGLCLGAITPARDAFISRLAPPANRGSVVGGIRTTYILLASGGTALAGFVIDRVGFESALLLFAGTLFLGALAALILLVIVPIRD